MSSLDLIAALALPDSALVDRRVPKTLLVENSAPTAADRRRIREDIEEIRWFAALKPTTVGVAEYRDAAREYLEIAVLQLSLRIETSSNRLTELVHRAVPYPVLLIRRQKDGMELSLAHKRWSQGESGKTVLDGGVVATGMINDHANGIITAFCDSLTLPRQPYGSLLVLYQGWIDSVQALRAAKVTGFYTIPETRAKVEDRASALQEYGRLESRISELSAAGTREKQIPRLAAINLELKRLRADRDAVRTRL
ncbi:MAG: DUF4391 domain-containing protein [Gemmatimonadota bacterium]|nr:DUF4391 domain-containing protein [Gemmatimonadota bacterium]